ncbi:ATP-binding protein, partial [bacterium]|nr:ATP-binding protein [bacterium]
MLTDTNNNKKTWGDFTDILSKNLGNLASAWINCLEPASDLFEMSDNGIFLIKSSEAFAIQYMQTRHLQDIELALKEFTGLNRAVRFMFDENVKKKKQTKSKSPEIQKTALKLDNLAQMYSFCGLNLKYTFANFVEGENSKFAYQIAKMIAKEPGQKYNPFFISGSVGLGKTHLMQAVGHSILKDFPNLKIRYTKAEEFGNKLIENLTTNKSSYDLNEKMKKFRDMYRNVDVLLIDDVQWIDKKKRTQEEIFNMFDTLYYAGNQIIFAADRPISEFEELIDGLKSRLEWGISATIKVPELDVRMKIVKHHAHVSGFEIDDDVALFLAENYSNNIRELEGAYNKASALASIEGTKLTVENTKKYLNLDKEKKKITIFNILEACSKYFSVTKEDIL